VLGLPALLVLAAIPGALLAPVVLAAALLDRARR